MPCVKPARFAVKVNVSANDERATSEASIPSVDAVTVSIARPRIAALIRSELEREKTKLWIGS